MKKNSDFELVKFKHPARPDVNYYRPKENKKLQDLLAKPHLFKKDCCKACTKVVDLVSKTLIDPHSGVGHFMVNVDGFRYINAYVISDPLNSSTMRGFELELSFSIFDFVYGVGVEGETSYFFNFDSWYNRTDTEKKLVKINTSDLTITGGLPWIGGIDLAHIIRVPVLGKFVRASVFNNDETARSARVIAYLTT